MNFLKLLSLYTIGDEIHHPIMSRVYRYVLIFSVFSSILICVISDGKLIKLNIGFYLIFLIDFLLRIVGSYHHLNVINFENDKVVSLKRFLFSFYGFIDFLSAVLILLLAFGYKNSDILLSLTLLSIFKLARYSPALIILKDVFISERKTLLAALYIMTILTLTTSLTLYFLERDTNPGFENLLNSIWWSIITLATVGYGDVVPQTPIGKLFGGFAAISGFGMFALPAGILANGFASELKRLKEIANWNMVAQVPLFSNLDSGVIYDIANLLRVKRFRKNEVIIKEGSYGDCMYFIVEGYVQVLNKDIDILLKKGSFFGEIALVENVPRTANVIAKTNCELLELSKYNFQSFIYSKPALLKQIQEVVKQRYKIS